MKYGSRSEFFNTKYGIRVLHAFNQMKADVEDPPKLIGKIVGNKINHDNYLDIGGGGGDRTIEIAKNLNCRHVDFLEPSVAGCKNFKKLAKSHKLDFSTFASGFESFKPKMKYDLITSIHSWYYIKLDSLKKLHKIINADGIACIMIDSRQDTIWQMQNICESQIYGFTSNTLEDVTKFLDKNKIDYTVHNDNRSFSGLIRNGKFTNKAKIITSLVSWTEWEKIPESTKESLMSRLLKTGKNDTYPSRRSVVIIKKMIIPAVL